jgi:hypothetical protein
VIARSAGLIPALAAVPIEPPPWSQLRELAPAFLAPAGEGLR